MRCIDADALEEVLEKIPAADIKNIDGQAYVLVRLSQVFNVIKNAPTIEPHCEACEAFNKTRLLIPQPERKKGKWIVHPGGKFVGFPYVHYECDQCRDFEPEERNFCPNCGADMRTPVETARDIVHEAIDNSVWSDTVDTAKMHNVVDDKYVEMTKKTEESKRCDTCKHEKERWFSRCADCSDYELWEAKDEPS